MSNVHMTPADLRGCADSFTRQANEQQRIYSQMRTLVLSLGTDWKGAAFDNGILESFMAQEQILQSRTEMLRQFAGLLRDTADDIERMDNDLVRSFAV